MIRVAINVEMVEMEHGLVILTSLSPSPKSQPKNPKRQILEGKGNLNTDRFKCFEPVTVRAVGRTSMTLPMPVQMTSPLFARL